MPAMLLHCSFQVPPSLRDLVLRNVPDEHQCLLCCPPWALGQFTELPGCYGMGAMMPSWQEGKIWATSNQTKPQPDCPKPCLLKVTVHTAGGSLGVP
jgi:hypothetical protein